MYQKDNVYEQKTFNVSEKVIVSKSGTCQFGIKFLALSRDGLLPQFPVRVSISEDPNVERVIVSSEQFRIIEYKAEVKLIESPNSKLPKFEVSLRNVNNVYLEGLLKLDIHLHSSSSDMSSTTDKREWVKESICNWGYDNKLSCSDLVHLPALILPEIPKSHTDTRLYRLTAIVLSLVNTTVSLTKVGRGYSPEFSFPVSDEGASPSPSPPPLPTPSPVSTDAVVPDVPPKPAVTPFIQPLVSPNNVVSLTAPLMTLASSSSLTNLSDQDALLQAHAKLADNKALSTSNTAPSDSSYSLEPMFQKSPHDAFRLFSQAAMKALNAAYTAKENEPFSMEAIKDAIFL